MSRAIPRTAGQLVRNRAGRVSAAGELGDISGQIPRPFDLLCGAGRGWFVVTVHGNIRRRPVLGGLISEYETAA